MLIYAAFFRALGLAGFDVEHWCEKRTGMRLSSSRNVLWRARGDDLPVARATLGPEVDKPVCCFDHIEVMLNDQHGIATVPQTVQYLQQLPDILKMEPVVGSSRMYSVLPVSRLESSWRA